MVGESGGAAALMTAPRQGAASDEVLDFVSSLVAHGQIADLPPKKRGTAAVATSETKPTATHAVVRQGGKKVLQRVAFACGPHPH